MERNPVMDNTARETTAWDAYLELLTRERWISNVPCDTVELRIQNQRLPVTLNLAGSSSTSWVASLRNVYGPYARDEARLIGMPWAAKLGSDLASYLGEGLLSLAGLAGGLYLNNWLVSTNLHQPEFDIDTICQARDSLRYAYPGQPVIVRSLMAEYHGELMASLVAEGFLLVPTRQVWLMDGLADGTYRKRHDVKNDLALERRRETCGAWVSGSEFSDFDWIQAARLYAELYRGKYPIHNPDYDACFLRACSRSGWLEVQGLRRQTGELEGVIGWVRRPGWMSCPLLGYDLHAPKEHGLYRRLNLRAFQLGEQEGRHMHCSGGAGAFKQTRGARYVVEFAAVSVEGHAYRKPVLKALSAALMRWAVPYLQSRAL